MLEGLTKNWWMYVIIIAIYFAIVFYIANGSRKKIKNSKDFFVAGRSYGGFIITLSFVATSVSSATYSGAASTGYQFGVYQFWAMGLGLITTSLSFILLGPAMRRMTKRAQEITVPGLLEARYESAGLRGISMVLTSIALILSLMSIYSHVARFIQGSMGLPFWMGVVIIGVVCSIYCSMGGFMSVAKTDAMGAVFLLAIILLTTPMAFSRIGGVTNIFSNLAATEPKMLEIPGFFAPMLLCFCATGGVTLDPWGKPEGLTRFFAMKDTRSFRWAPLLSTVFIFVTGTVTSFWGLLTRVEYPSLESADLAMSVIVKAVLPEFFSAVFLAAVIVAAATTVDSVALVISSGFTQDIYKRFINPDVSEKKLLILSKVCTALAVLVPMLIALNPPQLAMTLSGPAFALNGGAMFAPIVIGVLWKGGTKAGAYFAIIGGMAAAVVCLCFTGFTGLGTFYCWLPAFLVGTIGYIVVSKFTKKPSDALIEKLYAGPKKAAKAAE